MDILWKKVSSDASFKPLLYTVSNLFEPHRSSRRSTDQPSMNTRNLMPYSANVTGRSRTFIGNGSENPLENCIQKPRNPRPRMNMLKTLPFSSTAEGLRYLCLTAYVREPRAKSCAPRDAEWNAEMVICSDQAMETPNSLHAYLTPGVTHFLYSVGVSSMMTGSKLVETTLCAMPPTVTPMVTHLANLTFRL